MSIRYFDAHCHVQFDAFAADQAELVEKMQAEGVGGVVVGCDFESSRKAVELVQKHDNLWASVGLHPNDNTHEQFALSNYRQLAASPKVVAIGECGLDYFRTEPTPENKRIQRERFVAQVALAGELGKPLIVHSRPSKGTYDAYEDALAILQEAKQKHQNLRGDMHFFVGTPTLGLEFIALGFTLSFTAVITFAREYDSVIKAAPLISILSETDAPYVPPMSRAKGSRNDPLAVQDVVAKIAEIRGEPVETVRVALLTNAQKLFQIL